MWLYQSPELYHHGVLGMKWGVRITPEQLGRDASSKEKQKSKHRLKLEDKYRTKGYHTLRTKGNY